VFISQEDNSLILQINLNDIVKISQQNNLLDTFCFQINQHEAKSTVLEVGAITLCAENKNDMESWISAIQEFKYCDSKEIKSSLGKIKVIADFNKINSMKKNVEDDPLSGLFYDNAHKIFQKSKADMVEEKETYNAVRDLLDAIKMQQLKENQAQRSLNDKLMASKRLAEKIKKKAEDAEKIMNKKLENESKLEMKTQKLATNSKHIDLLKAVAQKIREIKVYKIYN
jgi:hypothetical protein